MSPGKGHGRSSFQDFIAFVAEIRGHPCQFQRAFPIVTPSAAAPFQGQKIQRTGCVILIQQHTAAPAKAGPAGKSLGIFSLHRRTEVQMLRNSICIDSKQVGIAFRSDMKDAVFAGNHEIPFFSAFSLL